MIISTILYHTVFLGEFHIALNGPVPVTLRYYYRSRNGKSRNSYLFVMSLNNKDVHTPRKRSLCVRIPY